MFKSLGRQGFSYWWIIKLKYRIRKWLKHLTPRYINLQKNLQYPIKNTCSICLERLMEGKSFLQVIRFAIWGSSFREQDFNKTMWIMSFVNKKIMEPYLLSANSQLQTSNLNYLDLPSSRYEHTWLDFTILKFKCKMPSMVCWL